MPTPSSTRYSCTARSTRSVTTRTLKANTAIAALMTMLNEFYDKGVNKAEYMTFLTLLNPLCAAYHRVNCGSRWAGKGLLSIAPWPQYDEAKTVEDYGRDGGAGQRQAPVYHQTAGRLRQQSGDRRRAGPRKRCSTRSRVSRWSSRSSCRVKSSIWLSAELCC